MNKKGFTLVELMVVIIIMAVVAIFFINIVGNLSEREIVKIRENTQVIIDEAKKLKEKNIDVKVKPAEPKAEVKKEEKKTEPPPKIQEIKPENKPATTEGLKPL